MNQPIFPLLLPAFSCVPPLKNLLQKVDTLIVGGGMAYTFLKAQGKPTGNSKLEKDKLELARSILDKAKKINAG